MRLLTSAALVGLTASLPVVAQDKPLFRDPSRPVDERVRDLLSRMTLEEKVAQTLALWKRKDRITDEKGRFDAAGAATVLRHGIGQIARPSELRDTPVPILLGPRENATFVNAVQTWLVENTRLGIPAMTHEEALHGLRAPRGTHFPAPIALASAWDPALIEKVMSVAALESRARGTHLVLSPVLDLARDPRWGRTEETYGEDPYLVSRLGVAAVRGYQGVGETLGRDNPDRIGPAGRATVTVDVTNTGRRTGDEVAQLYIRDRVASVTRPVKELRGFERVSLAPGERKTVTFAVGPEALRFFDQRMRRVVEPGLFDVMVGTSSTSLTTVPLEVVNGPAAGLP